MLYVLEKESGNLIFSYSAPGSVEAVFSGQDKIILARSTNGGNSSFLSISFFSGETVPIPYPALVGIRIYRGESGTIYAGVINRAAGDMKTSIIKLNISNPENSEIISTFNGEDSSFAMAESGGIFISTLGGGDAKSQDGKITIERSNGLPVKIIDRESRFIILDGEGSIAWHNSRTGKLLALLKLYPGSWILEKDGEIIQGKTAIKTGLNL
jgi:outer membrane protein assembly factor BamB